MSGISVRPVDAENVNAFVGLLYDCFGYTFEWPWVYDEGRVLEEQVSGRSFFYMAFDGNGDARALLGLNRRYPSDQLASLAPFVVDPRVSKADSARYIQTLLKAVHDRAWQLVLHEGLRALVAQAVCEHRLTQRLAKAMQFVATGVLIGITAGGGSRLRRPPDDRLAERDGSLVRAPGDARRTSEVLSVMPIPRAFKRPYEVSTPSRFASLLAEIYGALGVRAHVVHAREGKGASELACRCDIHQGLATIEVTRTGADAVEAVSQRVRHYDAGFAELIHVVLPLDSGNLDAVVESLVEQGFVYGALLPCYRTSDVLLMQRLTAEAVIPEPRQLVDPLARRILEETQRTR